jgi:hypothetical protein
MLNQTPLQVVQEQLDVVHLRSCGGADEKTTDAMGAIKCYINNSCLSNKYAG